MEIPAEEKFGMVVPGLFENIGRIAKAVDKKFGVEGRNLLRQVMGERGSEMGEMMKPLSPGEDFKSVGTFFARIVKMLGAEAEVEAKEGEVIVKGTRGKCLYGLEGTNRELCEAMMAFDKRIVGTLGPKVTMEIVKTVAAGDPQCELSFKPKK
jgi:predicted ArsR family transcriptional regulator